MTRRFKSSPYIRYKPLAFRVFGEMQQRLNRVVLRVWDTEDGPPHEIVCDTLQAAAWQRAVMIEGDRVAFEASAGG